MTASVGSIIRRVSAELVDEKTGTSKPLLVDARYNATDPWAVALDMHEGPVTTRWVVARDLLNDGMTRAEGIGDVVVTPHPFDAHTVVVELSCPQADRRQPNRAVLHFSIGELCDFLVETYDLVADGEEKHLFDFDHEISLLGVWE